MRTILILFIFPFYTITKAQSETALLKSADSLGTMGKYEAAIQVYSKLLKLKPQHEKALIGRAKSYGNSNKFALAEKDFNDAIAHNASCIECFLKLGLLKLLEKDIVAAYTNADKALQLDNKNAGAFLLKGRIALTEKKYNVAATNLNTSISLDSTNSEAFYFRATLFSETNLPDMALNDLEKTTELRPGMSLAYAEMGNIYADKKKWDEALKYYLLGLQRDSLNAEYYMTIGSLYSSQKKDPATAISYYTKAIRLNDKDGEAYVARGDAYYELEDMDGSCNDYAAAAVRLKNSQQVESKNYVANRLTEFCDSSNAAYYYQRGIANYNLNKFAKAVEWYTKGLAKFPRHYMLTSFRGNARMKLGLLDAAEADYTEALNLKDKIAEETMNSNMFRDATAEEKQGYITHSIAELYNFRSEVRLALNNYAGAMNDVDEALKLMPPGIEGTEDFCYTKGTIFLRQEDNNNALSWFNKALQISPGLATALVNRALVKLNLAYRTTVTQRSMFAKDATISLPSQTHESINTDNLESALADCNKAIASNSKFGYAYYVRAMVKIALKQSDQCYDLLKAEQLGYEPAKPLIQENKCR